MEAKLHLVKWSIVCTEKSKGGMVLGIRYFSTLNRALLCKCS